LFRCCAVDIGDAEVRSRSGAAAREREVVLGVGYELILGRDAFVDEESAVLGFAWACEDGGDGVAYCWCSGEAERDVTSVDDCGWANVSVCAMGCAMVLTTRFPRRSCERRRNTFSGPRPNIDDEGHHAQSPIEERSSDQQAVAKISIGPGRLSQTALMLDIRSEEWI